MPEVNIPIEWPGNVADSIYSPSTVIKDYFKPGDEFTPADFETKVTQALNLASERVYQRFGYECTSAMSELERLKSKIQTLTRFDEVIKIL